MELRTRYRYIHFFRVAWKPKDKWMCYNNTKGDVLGVVTWHAPWKQYEFIPASNTGYTVECLLDIADFIKQLQQREDKPNG